MTEAGFEAYREAIQTARPVTFGGNVVDILGS